MRPRHSRDGARDNGTEDIGGGGGGGGRGMELVSTLTRLAASREQRTVAPVEN